MLKLSYRIFVCVFKAWVCFGSQFFFQIALASVCVFIVQ